MPADLKFAWRRLLKSPSFAITAILTLALGIGANAVVFSGLNTLVLHTLNVPNAQRFYSIEERGQSLNSYPDYQDVRDRNRSFDGVLAFNFAAAGLDTAVTPPPYGSMKPAETTSIRWVSSRILAASFTAPMSTA
jgi:hypothetical protein